MTNDQSRSSSRSWIISLIATLAVLIFFCGFARMFNDSFRGNDDTVYHYQLAIELVHRSATAPLHVEVLKYLETQPDRELALRRWNLRVLYATNYLMPSAFIYAASRVLRNFSDGVGIDYAFLVALSIAIGVILCTAVAAAILHWAIVSSEDVSLALGTALGLAAIAVLSLLPQPPWGNPFLIDNPLTMASYLIQLFLIGGSEYSIFGYTPRGQFIVIALAIFLLRWKGFWTAAYLLTLLLAFLHQSLAGLFLMFLIAIDVVARPQIFDRRVIALCILGIVILFGRETLFTGLGLWPFVAAAAGAALLIAAALAAKSYGVQIAGFEAIKRRGWFPLRAAAERLGPIGSDLAIAFAFCLLALPVVAVMSRVGDPFIAQYFWAEAFIRVLMILQPALFVGLAILLIRWLAARVPVDPRWLYASIAAVAVGAAVPVASQAATMSGLGRATFMLSRFNPLLGQPLPQLDLQTREAVLHYAISYEIDAQRPVIRSMLVRR